MTEFMIELPFILAGHTYAYPTAIAPVTVFSGHWYQISLAECLAIVLTISLPCVILRHYARSRGTPHIFATSSPARPAPGALTRVLAATGFANLCVLAFMLLNTALAPLGGPIPSDTPAYLWPLGG
jgi:hypothetical protein